MTDETEQVSTALSPGQLLSEACKKAGMSASDIAERMNLKPAVIESIDRNDFDSLPDAIFVRGYLKAYARIVGLKPESVLEAYDLLGGKELDSLDMQSFSKRTSRERSNSLIMWLTYLIILVSLGFVVLWWWQKYQSHNEPLKDVEPQSYSEMETSQPKPVAIDVKPTALDVRNAEDSKQEPEALPAEDILPPSDSLAQHPTAVDAEPVLASESEPVAKPLAEVVLTFNHDCWIRVEDASGEVVAEGVKTPTRVVRFQGQAPFKAIFGLPSAVQVEYQGEPMAFDVKDPTRPLRLTIPNAE